MRSVFVILYLRRMKYIFAFVFIIYSLVGCKKYPEGGRLFGIATTEDRIVGPYHVYNLMVNNVDSSMVGNPNLCTSKAFTFSFVKNEFDGKILKSTCGAFPTNSWAVTGDKKQLLITCSFTNSADELYPIIINKDISVTWDIQRLTKDELWLKTNLYGREYYLKLQYAH